MTMKPISLSIVLLILFVVQLNAQSREPTEQEIDQLFDKAEDLMSKVPYREASVWQSYNSGQRNPSFVSTTIQEVVPPNSSRFTWKTQTVERSTETETIRIGQNIYSRKDKGGWMSGEPGPPEGFVIS